MIERLVPDQVHHCEAWSDDDADELFPEERAVLTRAVPQRRQEFATVRRCARAALAGLGHPPVPLLPGERGAPGWPAGIVGSMTHCAGYRGAAVADAQQIATIGIDAEPDEALPGGVLHAIARPEEDEMLDRLPPGPAWDRLLFSAKESVYKAWFPRARRVLDFEQASVVLRTDGSFTAQLLVPAPPLHGRELPGFTGRWLAQRGVVMTAIVVPVPAGSPRS